MEQNSPILYILLAILVTNLIRVVPMLFIKGPINNTFVRSFLSYVPYVTLAVMTFPAIIETTLTPLAVVVALVVGLVAAWFRLGLFPVSIICCLIVYLIDSLLPML